MACDQATRKSGICIMDSITKKIIFSDVLEETDKDYVKRIYNMKTQLFKLFDKFKCEIIVFEETIYQNNARALIMLSQLQGMILDECLKRDLLYIIPTTKEWRSQCDIKGRKREEQKQNAIKFVKDQFNIDVSEDEAEAVCIAYYASSKFFDK